MKKKFIPFFLWLLKSPGEGVEASVVYRLVVFRVVSLGL